MSIPCCTSLLLLSPSKPLALPGARRGIASDHGDPLNWLSRFGVTMDDFRRDTAARMEETTVTQEQFDAMLADWLRRQGEQPADSWAAPLLERAKAAGITDGTRPRSFATRQEAAAMVLAAQKLKDK